jgi:hypothetical protein
MMSANERFSMMTTKMWSKRGRVAENCATGFDVLSGAAESSPPLVTRMPPASSITTAMLAVNADIRLLTDSVRSALRTRVLPGG